MEKGTKFHELEINAVFYETWLGGYASYKKFDRSTAFCFAVSGEHHSHEVGKPKKFASKRNVCLNPFA